MQIFLKQKFRVLLEELWQLKFVPHVRVVFLLIRPPHVGLISIVCCTQSQPKTSKPQSMGHFTICWYVSIFSCRRYVLINLFDPGWVRELNQVEKILYQLSHLRNWLIFVNLRIQVNCRENCTSFYIYSSEKRIENSIRSKR